MIKFKHKIKLSIALLLVALLLAVGLVVGDTKATQFKITKVVELASNATSSPVGRSIRWSPNGLKIAYFKDSILMLSDSLGNTERVTAISPSWVKEWEWTSDKELVLHCTYDSSQDVRIDRLLKISINNPLPTELETFRMEIAKTDPDPALMAKYPWKKKGSFEPDRPMFKGPFRNPDGSVYFIHDDMNLFGEYRRVLLTDKEQILSTDSTIWTISPTKNGVYAINEKQGDSVLLTTKIKEPAIAYGVDLIVSSDRRFVVRGGAIVDVKTDELFFLDTMIQGVPPGTAACGYRPYGFNPTNDELLFRRGCDDGHDSTVASIGVINLITKQCTLFSDIPFALQTGDAQYSTNGRDISYVANGRLYLIIRGEQ